MKKFMAQSLTLGVAGFLAVMPSLAQQQPQKPAPPSQDPGMAQAIQFERAKDAADARQAKIEAEHPCGCATPADAQKAATTPEQPQPKQILVKKK